ncbi:phosphodiester glycosidase family protein [Arthrobacter sp. NEB 688]|uniref:phosphodiester glycosidase family protein n=1 Tax=Arthrobacter sp. NEB 688 TaxID=904039 RepID=UPI0015672269|nr:phosphodiester glycosidase family protein [Arthrobacter sp. NEB 688]QKE85770.1 phosphodiester glycosidase family protein [Arthrobacter sp. NEB 688]
MNEPTSTLAPDRTPPPPAAGPPRRVGRRALLGGGLGLAALAATGTGWALERYVVDHVEVASASAYEASQGVASAATASTGGSVSATTYTSDLATVDISRTVVGSGDDQLVYFTADLRLQDATVLRSAFADDEFGQNIIEVPSAIAATVGAVWAVNGDYYGFRDDGIVVRNGVAYRDAGARQGLAWYRDGSMRLYDETATSARTLVSDGVWQTLSFGPGLVDDGAVVDGIDSVEVDTNFGNHSVQGDQPRTGIGLVDTNHLLVIVADGRSVGYSRGIGMSELAQVFVDRGARVAYNLDGGGSSAMVFDGDLVNDPLGRGQERGTSDILYVGA